MKRILALWALIPALCFTAGDARAGANTPLKYSVTILSLELSKDGGSTYVPVSSQSAVFDIASAGAAQAVGAYASGADIPPGEYNRIRVRVSNTFTLRGNALNTGDGLTYCTRSNGNPVSAACPGVEQDQSMTILLAVGFPANATLDAANNRITIVDTTRIVVDPDRGRRYRINFSITSGINVSNAPGNNTMFPGPPTVTITEI